MEPKKIMSDGREYMNLADAKACYKDQTGVESQNPEELHKWAKSKNIFLKAEAGYPPDYKGRYSLSITEEFVQNPAYEGTRAGRIELWDREEPTGYPKHESHIVLPEDFYQKIEDLVFHY